LQISKLYQKYSFGEMEFHEFKSAILQLLTRNEYTIENDDVGYN